MKPLAKPLLWLGAAIAVGATLVMVIPRGPEASRTPAPETAVGNSPGQTGQAATPMALPAAGTDTLPWMSPGAGGAQATAATRAQSTANPLQPSSSEITRAVVQVREQAVRNERNADELLRQIDAMQASGQAPPGVNLDALRNNLLVSKRAQALAREVAELTQQPDTPARQKRIDDITRELQGLQSQLRHDIGSPTTAPATPAVLGRKQ